MKLINELTETEAKEILASVFPNKDYILNEVSHTPFITEDGGSEEITFGGRSKIGILYRNDYGDNCILHFDNTKVVLWLYKNGYDITEQLEYNSHFSDMESKIDNIMFEIFELSNGNVREEYKTNYTLEYVEKKCKKLFDRYLNIFDG